MIFSKKCLYIQPNVSIYGKIFLSIYIQRDVSHMNGSVLCKPGLIHVNQESYMYDIQQEVSLYVARCLYIYIARCVSYIRLLDMSTRSHACTTESYIYDIQQEVSLYIAKCVSIYSGMCLLYIARGVSIQQDVSLYIQRDVSHMLYIERHIRLLVIM